MDGFREFFHRQYTDSDVVHLYHQDLRVAEIANTTGRSVGDIYRTLHKNNSMPNRLGAHHDSVFYYHDSGYSVPQIANFTGYTERNVRYILKQKTK